MAIKDIVKDTDILTQKSVPFVFGEDDAIIQDLHDTATAHEDNCAGLAAIQLGIPKRVIVVKEGSNFVTYINPVIVKRSRESYVATEGCLSLDGPRTVKRYRSVMVSYTTPNGKKKSKTFDGFVAEILQHEIDHCNGALI